MNNYIQLTRRVLCFLTFFFFLISPDAFILSAFAQLSSAYSPPGTPADIQSGAYDVYRQIPGPHNIPTHSGGYGYGYGRRRAQAVILANQSATEILQQCQQLRVARKAVKFSIGTPFGFDLW